MGAMAWLGIPVVATGIAIAWVAWTGRKRPPADPNDTVADYERFKAAMTGRGSGTGSGAVTGHGTGRGAVTGRAAGRVAGPGGVESTRGSTGRGGDEAPRGRRRRP